MRVQAKVRSYASNETRRKSKGSFATPDTKNMGLVLHAKSKSRCFILFGANVLEFDYFPGKLCSEVKVRC